jgi:hypothetical protein
MRRGSALPLSIATAAFILLLAQFASAQASADNGAATKQQAVEMRPAPASLTQPINATKVKEGDPVKATLNAKIQLKNGSELPSGTDLTGQVTVNQMREDGKYRLALVFNNAQLSNGTVIPIKATIMQVYGSTTGVPNSAVNYHPMGLNVTQEYPIAKYWTGKSLRINQLNALNGVDLESSVAGDNSGNFVSKNRGDIKLSPNSVLILAIAPQK